LEGAVAIVAIPPKILACRALPDAHPALLSAIAGLDPERHRALGLLTCDQDDSLYAALDHATKFADVDVVFARSLYAGAAHASGPFSGEIMGVLAAPEPDSIEEGLAAAAAALAHEICFYEPVGGGPAFFPHVIAETGRYLSREAGIAPGEPLGYLIAPPLEATIALDAALKAADVRLLKYFPPPTETNFAGAYITGALHAVEAAAAAFAEAVVDVARRPLAALRTPGYRRR
jgi:ethanolamine utilization protein EutL